MEDTIVVIMQKDEATGFLDKELASCKILEHEELIVNIYAKEGDDGHTVHMKLTIDRDAEDWEFSAIYDYYDMEVLAPEVTGISEVEDCYNPTWEVTFPFIGDMERLEEKISGILSLHSREIAEVYEVIEENKQDYLSENRE